MTFLCLTFGWGNAYADPTHWDGSVASKFASGTGTKSNPYIISTAAELAYFGTNYNGSYCYYKINADIDLGGRVWAYHTGKTFYGHLIGDKGNGAKPVISNYKINVPTTSGNYGLLGSVSGGEIRNIGVSTVTITCDNNMPQYQKCGAFIGNVESGSLVEGCSADNVTANVVTQKNEVHSGGFIGRVGGSNTIIRNCTMNGYTINILGGSINNGNYGAFVGCIEGLSTITDCSIETIMFNTTSTLQGCNLSGISAKMKGTNASNRSVITGCSVKGFTYDIKGTMNMKVAIGSITSWVNGNSDITRCKATGLDVELSGDIWATGGNDIRLGGMVAKLENGCTVTDCILYGENYIGAKSGITGKKFSDGICMNVGGVVGSTVSQGNSSGSQIVIERCVAYCDFDFTGYIPNTTGKFKGNEFVIGGVVGRLYNPYYIPNTLYYSGKVKAPYCVVGPLVGTFQKDNGKDDFIHSDYSGTNNTQASDASYSNWSYGDYKIWLSPEVKASGKTMNVSTTDEDGYASIGNVTSWPENCIGSDMKASKTILPYNSQGDDVNMSIYPKYTATSGFPDYYMYYAQGVNRGNHQSNINTVLTALRVGTDHPIWDVVGGKIVMDEFKVTEHMKEDNAFYSVLTVEKTAVEKADGSAIPKEYTYEWKIGETTVGTGAVVNVPRAMEVKIATLSIKDTDTSTLIGTRTVTIPRKEWFDVGAMEDTKAHPVDGSGTSEAPYQIGSKENLAWMAYHISKTNAKNTEYYELTADIDLDEAWWSPMNDVEVKFGGSFAGVFDGHSFTIHNLHIDWEYKYTEEANFGLFSIIEGVSNTKYAVVRNLVIDYADVTKSVNTTLPAKRNIGILAGTIKKYSQIENVIVRKSGITASETKSSQNGKMLLVGGLAGKINDSANDYQFLNISTDVNINLTGITVNSNDNVVVGGMIGQWQSNARSCVTNVYTLGSITVPSGPANIGSVFGQNTANLTDAVKATIFYVNPATNNVGSQRQLAEFASTFLETANEAATPREELYLWVYGATDGYSLSKTGVKVVDIDWQQPRFATHTMEIQGMETAGYTYRWILNGEEKSTSTTYEVKPVVPGDATSLEVRVFDGEDVIATIPVPIPTGKFLGAGTSSNPYLIGCKEELQLLSYLSNQKGSNVYNSRTTTEYNQAYYMLDDNVNMSGITDFTPIGAVKDNYQTENCFRGYFDGKGYTIEGIRIGWLAGDVNAEVNRVWGLFGAVQGVSTSQKAVIQNLVIKNAVLTHKTDNTSFYYGNESTGNANNCYVGVLAGIVGANTTIQNIEVSGSSIIDTGSSSYNIANHTLSVGGIIGRAQYSFSTDGDINSSTVIRLLSSDCDITINNAAFASSDAANEYKINVAGIIGSMKSTGASATMPWPSYTYYTGQMSVVGKGMVSPVFSCAIFKGNTTIDYEHYCNLYVGKVNSMDNAPVNSIYYGNYQIGGNTITETNPANQCDMGARTLVAHSHSGNGDSYYQGVNYGTYISASNESDLVSAFNDGRNNASNNSEIKLFGFSFDASHNLHLGEVFDIIFTDNHLGNANELTHTLTVSNRYGDEGLTYRWYNNEVESGVGSEKEITLGVTPQLVHVKVYRGDDLKYTTNVIDLPRGYKFSVGYESELSGESTATFTVLKKELAFTDENYEFGYAWQEWSEGSTTEVHYTALECFERNRPYIVSVKNKDTNVDIIEANWTDDIYANPDKYVVTYSNIYDVISSEEYALLTAEEKTSYVEQSDGTYRKDTGDPYIPISTSDTYTTSSAGKINVVNGTVNNNVLSGANVEKTYYCTITATDKNWRAFISVHGEEDMYKALVSKYPQSFITELTVRVINENVIFLHPTGDDIMTSYPAGNDGNDGRDDQHPVATWQRAYELLADGVTWDHNMIVLIGRSNRNATCDVNAPAYKGFSITKSLQGNVPSELYAEWKGKVDASHLAKNVTITGQHNKKISEGNYQTVDYKGTIEAYEDGNNGVKYIGIFGDTRFQNITFNHDTRAKHSSYIFCQYHNLEMGEGVQMTGFTSNAPGYGTIDGAKTSSFQIYGGLNNDKRFRTDKGVLDMDAMDASMPHGKEGFTITLRSGHYSCITPAGRQSTSNQINGLMGTPNMPIKCTVTIDIDRQYNNDHNEFEADYDVGIIAASHEGPMYADLDIVIKSGYVARVVNGHMGNQKNFNFDYNGKNYRFPDNTYSGRANILVDPRDGDNSKVIITELYGGSTGRGFTGGITIKNPFYGYSTVTIKGGTFTILPENNPKKNMIFSGVFGSGAGGYNGVGDDANPTVDEHIAYWSPDNKVVLYGPYADAKDRLVSVKCYNADDPANPYTMVDPAKTNTSIVIEGGVFGSSTQPIDGIYAGGSGFMSPSLFYDRGVVPSKYGGNIYGKAGETVSTLTITGGTFYCDHGIFAGGRGTDKFYAEDAYAGNPADYTELGKTYGNVVLNINGGTMYCNVYGGGAGVAEALLKNTSTYGTLTNMARLTGNTFVNIGGDAKILSYNGVGGNVYGGGMLAAVDGTTTVNISGNAKIAGNVFGAAQGITNDVSITTIPHTSAPYLLHTPENATLFGLVNGNTVVKTSGNPSINGDIYGGAESAITNGSTSITLNGCTLDGNIYGGGLGALNGSIITASADVTGNTYIRIDKANYASTTADYRIFGGGNAASKVLNGKTEIVINGCTTTGQMTVYGGGYGLNTSAENTYITVNEFATEETIGETEHHYGLSSIYGGGYAGSVSGKTNIALNGGQIFGDVFGGGDVATVGTAYPSDGDAAAQTTYLNTYASRYGTEISMQGVGPVIYGNIYGGGNKAHVYGNATVSMSKGAYAGDIFGGGNGYIEGSSIDYADIYGSTNVYVNGATVIWNRKWDLATKKLISWNGRWDGDNRNVFLSGDEYTPVFLCNHNVYGGGNKACRLLTVGNDKKSGVATVDIARGFCDYDILSTDVWKNAYDDNKNPHFYVFGGGYGAYTSVGSTKVNVGVNDDAPEGATTEQQLAKSAGLTLDSKSMAPRKRISSGEGTDEATIGVYDNSYGIAGFTVLGVIGGGYAGLVEQNTDVKVGGNTYMHRVFGGGYGQLAAYNELTTNPDVSATDHRKLRDVLGEVGGNATVHTDGGYIYGEVFGGGAGVVSEKLSGNTYTDFKDMARVHGTTSVTISGKTQVFGSVYGGGDVANVGEESASLPSETPYSRSIFDVQDMFIPRLRYEYGNAQSFVNIIGGDIFGMVFAGGNGRMKSEASDYRKLGRVEGNTIVHVADSTLADGSTLVPTIWNRIFGGCSYGTVHGSTFVHIEGGKLGYNIFGGGSGDAAGDTPESQTNGSYANIDGNTTVKIDGGTWLWNQRADTQGNIEVWKDVTQVVVNNVAELRSMTAEKFMGIVSKYVDSRFYTIDASGKCSFDINHNIYGGGKDACNVAGTAKITINHSPLARLTDDRGNSINMLDETTVGGLCWYASISNTANPQFSVFGGGWGINTKVGETDVYVGPGARFNDTGEKLLLKPYDDNVPGTNLKYDAANPENNKKFYFDIAPPGDTGKEPYAYMNDDISEYVIFENALLDDFNSVTPEERIRVYGSVDGGDTDTHTFLRYRASRLAMSLGLPTCVFMDIHGGGFSGYVTGNTKVVTDCELACRNVFGGGLGSLPADPKGNETYGEVGGNTQVSLYSGFVSLNVFGGGAGVESYKKDDTYIDFPDIARVVGKTKVDVWGEAIAMNSDIPDPSGEGYQTYDKERVLVFGNVYGGGDVANVYGVSDASQIASATDNKKRTIHIEDEGSNEKYKDQDNELVDFTTSVSVLGGGVFSSVYAGGNGRTKDKCNDYTKLGAVYGNTHFCVKDTKERYPYVGGAELEKPVIPYIWNRIYGGCQNGTVYGNTFVDVNGGYLVYNIFGGGFGNVDSLEVDGIMTPDPNGITSADVKGNTNIVVRNGEMKVNSLWDAEKRTWGEAHVVNRNGEMHLYSPQYEPELKKFVINHNIYAGGRRACVVGGSTNLTMKRGLLPRNLMVLSGVSTEDEGGFFNTKEWEEVYHKVGSPHFCVFGGGYGENTVIENNTYLNIELAKGEVEVEYAAEIHDEAELHSHFYSRQAVMDVIGGGYSGIVRGTTNVTVGGETFLRRVFGGGFYAPVGATNVNIKSIDCNDIFGGGLMGDVGFTDAINYSTDLKDNPDNRGKVTINIGTDKDGSGNYNTGKSLYVHCDVYGGNDVSGDILNKSVLNISAGHVFGNVYGAGNGDYLYAIGRNKEKSVTVNEYYKQGKNTYDLVYTVPMRSFMPGISASTAAQRMVNCNSYRPKVQNVEINLKGNYSDKPLELGGVYGGGNSATVSSLDGNKSTVVFNFGSNLDIKNVFMGCDGDDMFDKTEKYRKAYEDLNSLHLEDEIDWLNNPANHGITQQYLPVAHKDRPRIYEHLLDLYFQPVEMEVQPTVNWASDMTNVTIGSFFCGGNRGSMNVAPDENGKIVSYSFPVGLVITDKIVGGCNMANYKMPSTGVIHKGGYLLGERGKNAIDLTILCQFKPNKNGEGKVIEGGNVYGGCYTSGTIDGDVHLDVRSDMLANVTPADIAYAKENDLAVCNVYGAGYGSLAYVRGNTKVEFGKNITKNYYSATASAFDSEAHGSTVNTIFGGGQQGNLVGNSKVIVYNGHVANSVCGGSYSGLMWGSTHVLVGNPKYYRVNKSGTYNLLRTDKWNGEEKNEDASDVVKKSISLLAHDIISEEVFDAIWAYDPEHTQATTGDNGNFSNLQTLTPDLSSSAWNDIEIKIDEAVYGGGYALSSGSSVAAGSYTVRKYDAEENLDEYLTEEELAALGANGTKGFGGNSTVLIWDAPTDDTNYETDHISVSSQTMSPKTISDDASVFGYYYKDGDKYIYIYQEDYKKGNLPNTAETDTDGKAIIYEYKGDGGMYGDGHLSFVEGFRSGELYGYGFAGMTPDHAKILNTFQRMDMLRITDCAVLLLGARDYNMSDISTTPYSIARVGEIQMVAQNVKIENNALATDVTTKRSRNYVGLSNNIHYLGAIFSNVAFTDDYRGANGAVENGKTYLAKKQDYIAYKGSNDTEFQKRNDGRAANMIGIASGYSLKVQNVKNVAGTDRIFYGPVVGIVEISLINVRGDEGGGYVYAKNIHTRKPSPAKEISSRKKAISTDAPDVEGTEDFLQTSGNFVFPYSSGNYIVDDCFSHGYDHQAELAIKDDIHYWYVTGKHYYYNTTITGYTYDSSKEPKKFNSINEDELMNLACIPAGSDVKLTKVTWRSAHTYTHKDGDEDPDDCDLEVRNQNSTSDAYQKYQLLIGATSETTYTTPEKGAYRVVPFVTSTESELGLFTGKTNKDDANIVLQLVDKADNSGTEYYQSHLSEPCKATIELEAEGAEGTYTYTIYLTINYVQGPDVTGKVKVENCALPGEMIEIDKGSIEIAADHSMAQYATIYRFGPREKDADGNWHFKKDGNGNEIYYTYEVGNPYQADKGSDNATSEILSGVVFDDSNTTNPCIRIPAYYFMNGYGVQYCFKVYGLEEIFAVPMDDDSKLLVHNYHRMEPRRSGGGIFEGDRELDLHLDLAAKRAAEVNSDLPEPRIYIEDAIDLKKFSSFLNAKINDAAETGSKNDFGANMQFFLQDNIIAASDYAAPECFKGTLHGDGHAISGIDNAMPLFKTLGSKANIHNLGLVSGKIVGGTPSNKNESLHCCYEYGQNVVYRMDGTAVRNYTKDDWRYGKVAYELNQYYLHKRFVVAGETSENAQDYVEKYYENGDYLYAGYAYDNHFEGSEFIRDSYLPNYGYAITSHDVTHPVDESRAVKDGDGNVTHYEPLFNDNLVDMNRLKNDYFFFGQILDEETKNRDEAVLNYTLPAPRAINEESDAYNLVSDMTNRIYRAGGYYGSKNNNGFYYNSDAYVHDNGITAIDFYGYDTNGQNYTEGVESGGNISSATGTGMNYYYPVSDYGMSSIDLADGVTRNLLLYARSASDRAGVLAKFNYTDAVGETAATPESDIKAHVIDLAATPTTEYLHLVERTADNKNSEGGDCFNNDFNCPIAFTVHNRAWYTRMPRYYAANKNDAWEGMSLPFSVNRVVASFNGEISHFYGADNANSANAAVDANNTNLGHEYWLRGFINADASADVVKATFSRPGSAEGLFAGGTLTGDYSYSNSHFSDIYGTIYGDNGFSIYGATRNFTGYYFQQSYVPYIVSFPGATFKEFDLSGDFNEALTLSNHGAWDALRDAHGFSFVEEAMQPQKVTFSWYGNNSRVSNLSASDGNLIGVTDDAVSTTTVGTITHHATFSALSDGGIYGIDDRGTAFSVSNAEVLPFRTYMTVSSSAKAFAKPQSILIYEKGGIEELPEADDTEIDGLRIYAKNRKIYVESPTALSLSLYTATGQLVRVFDVVPGTNTYSGFSNGIYIIGKKKLYVK